MIERRERLRAVKLRAEPLRERMGRSNRDLDRAGQRIDAAATVRLARLSDRLEALDRMRRSLGYTATLERGYAVVRSADAVVTGVDAARGASLEIEFRDGRIAAQAEGQPAPKKGKGAKPPDQGSLF